MRWLLAAVVLMLALAGCGDDGGDGGGDGGDGGGDGTETAGPTTGTGTGTETGTGTSEPRGPVTWDVEVLDNEYSPSSLTIQVGDTVRWTHNGTNPHTVTADDGSFDSHPGCEAVAGQDPLGQCMSSGQTFEHTFQEAGDVAYACKVHPSMTGTITVLERHDETP